MRARLASMAVAAISLVGLMTPANATALQSDVNYILNAPAHRGLLGGLFGRKKACLTQSAVVLPACNGPATCNLMYKTMPAVLANSGCGAAVITQYPSDIDVRRLRLQRDITDAMAAGVLGGPAAANMLGALSEVGAAELAYRGTDRELNTLQARRLYKAMDRIGRDFSAQTHNYGWTLIGDRGPSWWY